MYSIIVWNIHQPISTSEMCLAVFFVILILGALGGKIGEIVLKWGFLGLNILNISIGLLNAQVLFANFITNVLHENADLNHRTAIWQVVLAKIAESPLIGHGLNMGNVSFAVGQGIAGINQATHNGILYFVFSSGIIGTVYILGICFLLLRKTNQRTAAGRVFCAMMICFSTLWITEQLKLYTVFFICLLLGSCVDIMGEEIETLD